MTSRPTAKRLHIIMAELGMLSVGPLRGLRLLAVLVGFMIVLVGWSG